MLEKHSEQDRHGILLLNICFSDLVGLNNSAILYFVTEVEGEDIGELELEEEVVSLAESTGDNRTSSLTG